jgi:hypothetical protein
MCTVVNFGDDDTNKSLLLLVVAVTETSCINCTKTKPSLWPFYKSTLFVEDEFQQFLLAGINEGVKYCHEPSALSTTFHVEISFESSCKETASKYKKSWKRILQGKRRDKGRKTKQQGEIHRRHEETARVDCTRFGGL